MTAAQMPANGVDVSSPGPAQQAPGPGLNLGMAENNRRQLAAVRLAASLGQIVGIMMRAPAHRHTFLSDLELLVVPAIVSNQFVIHEERHTQTGVKLPVAVVLWARVSEEVDARLIANPTPRPRLRPEEWTSGSIPWLVEAIGDPQVTARLLKGLVERRLKPTGLKIFTRETDGNGTIKTLRMSSQAPQPTAPVAG